jgi:hypothetical protein
MNKSSLRLIVLVAVALCACQKRPCSPRYEYAPDKVRATLQMIEKLRGLSAGSLVSAVKLNDTVFRKKALELQKKKCKKMKGSDFTKAVEWVFNHRDADCDKLEEEKLSKDRGFLAGCYDESGRTVYTRDLKDVVEKLGFEPDLDEVRSQQERVLAHELFHWLQHEHFKMIDPVTFKGFDERHAADALYEGDATVVEIVVDAVRQGFSWKYRLERMLHDLQTEPHNAGAYLVGMTPWDNDPDKIELAYRFNSYAAGAAFVARLYFEGGFDLVNQAYRHLPKTTEQVLHPEKYLAGELGIEVDPPAVPEGSRIVYSLTLGEMMIRTWLSACTEWERACRASAGWGGDRMAFIEDQQGRTSIVWLITWDDEESAKRFFRVATKKRDCIGALLRFLKKNWEEREQKPVGEASGGVVLGRREGRKTGFTVGIEEVDAFELLPKKTE